MRYKGFLWAMLLVFLAGLALSVQIILREVDTDVDMVSANQILKTVESHWDQIGEGDYSGTTQEFVVLDEQGKVLHQSAEGLPANVNDAVRHRNVLLKVTVDGAPAGQIILYDDYKSSMQESKYQLALIIAVTFTALALLGGLLIYFINRTMMKPFKELQGFALNIAQGNLDIPLKMDANNPFGAFTESFDIMREELAAARQSEYEANRSKKELVATLSHDVKTPVASIKALSELMLARAADEKLVKQLGMIHAKAEQINSLVTDMFHATLEELQELKVNVSEDYSHVLKQMFTNVNYDDQITWDPVPDCMIRIDALRLQQVIDNCISNAYKYAGTAIRVSFTLIPIYLVVDIMDYGQGVSREELLLLFNKFYRGHNAEGHAGAGLGLFISKYLMQNMEGDMECHNRDDGFTVTLYIKLA
ncbi:sensor histidine kinase [Paenibacillus sp. CAA11]|uniref:HAMP domain-containing sensor histidine kinase n=1 Tax=Paenibacillus sp. CAA11 TaxID=1532905 RepID=UPI000D3B2AA7|nr:HAMP domain-containing sensor histidine kinase [Paenibacillus sp. CAA11]AWB46517.1 sensor histidine kinase [Paenibacillus sp. CAA11]